MAAQGDAGLKELLAIVADDRDRRLPSNARACVIVLAAQLDAVQTMLRLGYSTVTTPIMASRGTSGGCRNIAIKSSGSGISG